MAQNYSYPASVSSNPSIGPNGSPIPTSSTLIAGKGPTGNETPVSVDTSGNQNVNVVSSVLPTGAATESTLAAMSLKLPASLGSKVSASSLSVVIASDQVVPISASALPLPSGASTSALQTTGNTSIASIDTKTPTVGQKAMAASSPIVIASDQSSIPVTGTFFQSTQPISAVSLPLPTGASTETTLAAMSAKLPTALGAKTTANSLAVNIASDQTVPVSIAATVAISAASLPLPTGAATSAAQTTAQTSLSSIVTNTTGLALTGQLPTSLGAKTTANSVAVNIASDQTVAISAASLPLPTGAATAANQTTLSAQIPTTLGQKTSANSLAVTIASDQSSLPSKLAGKSAINKARNDYTSTSVTTAAYVQLIASTAAAISELYIFDSSGQTLVLATGAAASEVDQIYITPGGNGVVPLAIAAGVRVSIKAVSATANVGEIDINFLG